jgi:hypothetical protein
MDAVDWMMIGLWILTLAWVLYEITGGQKRAAEIHEARLALIREALQDKEGDDGK